MRICIQSDNYLTLSGGRDIFPLERRPGASRKLPGFFLLRGAGACSNRASGNRYHFPARCSPDHCIHRLGGRRPQKSKKKSAKMRRSTQIKKSARPIFRAAMTTNRGDIAKLPERRNAVCAHQVPHSDFGDRCDHFTGSGEQRGKAQSERSVRATRNMPVPLAKRCAERTSFGRRFQLPPRRTRPSLQTPPSIHAEPFIGAPSYV
jgi:hypothetical protein